MIDDLVTWDEDGVRAWADTADGGQRVLLHSLRGFIDAGHAGALLVQQILDGGEAQRVATFDIDRLLDYRSRRPEMVFSVNAFAEYDEPFLVVDLVKDAKGRAFLLHHGLEPDGLWEAYAVAVKGIVERLSIDLVSGAHGIPMAAPHTREVRATVHGTRPDLLAVAPSFFSTVTVPGSASNLVEYRMGGWGIHAVSVAVHVPHYLSQAAYPQATQRMAHILEEITGLDLAPHKLDQAAHDAAQEIAKQVEASEDVQALVTALEQQYDDFLDSREGVFPLDGRIPTGDEIGAEFEKFLADRGKDVP